MVYIPRELAASNLRPECTCPDAYIVTPISEGVLQNLKSRLEHGDALRFNPQVEFKIQLAPPDYIGKPHPYTRKQETQGGREEPFLIIDERAETDCAVWYVDDFGEEYELDDHGTGFAASSTEALHEVLVRASMVAWMYLDTEVSPGPSEQLINSVFKNYHTPGNGSGRCVAKPGEFEESRDDGIIRTVGFTEPDLVARLKVTPAEEVHLKDGTVHKFPRGSVWLDVDFDTKFDWP
ncbi:hypothetical protein GQ53DRAFT_781371 [Thozetella sp. PMI_491]|nr:hypothetical protein GQ53DRAFT_781371 [Thozetella sp. PMI_491]